jgi:hypothetical protein
MADLDHRPEARPARTSAFNPVAANIEETAVVARFNIRTLSAALAALVLWAHGAKAENYAFGFVPPCLACNLYPRPGLPDVLGPSPNSAEPAGRPAEQPRMHPTAPGAPSARRRR